MVPSRHRDGRRADTHCALRFDRRGMGALGARIHVCLPESQRQWPVEHVGRAGHHRGLRTGLNFHLGLPHGGRLHSFSVVHRLVLGNGLHDAAQRRLMRIETSLLVRSVKGLR